MSTVVTIWLFFSVLLGSEWSIPDRIEMSNMASCRQAKQVLRSDFGATRVRSSCLSTFYLAP